MNEIIRISERELRAEVTDGKKSFKREYPKAKYSHYCLELTPMGRLRLVLVGDYQGKEITYSIAIA